MGGFSEFFRMRLGYWDAAAYRRSWCRAVTVLDSDPGATSCLVTSMYDPASANFVLCWPLYRSGDAVYDGTRP
ncbi:hypothetical protein LX83_003574 [Goodfellowiella coeruleoviolacea]|uniref:CdiI C-terminal domain-containing protein n=1 Tax=Goodfellowiella coeruleoviolacea TaxID=334858 RepID=A0AAE3KHB9_9PSEU|nr:hypothetical protein [Goodfellowiella coeruleoviolacea]